LPGGTFTGAIGIKQGIRRADVVVKEILMAYLKEHGFDGLCNPDMECGCGLDDFMLCENNNIGNCQPGYTWKCTGKEARDCESEAASYSAGEKCKCYQLIKQEG
jgi:hypothetical protein